MEERMKTWRKVQDGKIHRIITSPGDVSLGLPWEEIPNDWGGAVGDDAAWFDDAGRRIPDDVLVLRGIRTDERGRWYSTEQAGESKILYNLDEEPGEGWTRLAPPDKPFQIWDGERWATDEAAKTKAETEEHIAQLRSEIDGREWHWAKAQKLGVDVEEVYPGERAWYNETVAHINELEATLPA
jgi:hypothetical protein